MVCALKLKTKSTNLTKFLIYLDRGRFCSLLLLVLRHFLFPFFDLFLQSTASLTKRPSLLFSDTHLHFENALLSLQLFRCLFLGLSLLFRQSHFPCPFKKFVGVRIRIGVGVGVGIGTVGFVIWGKWKRETESRSGSKTNRCRLFQKQTNAFLNPKSRTIRMGLFLGRCLSGFLGGAEVRLCSVFRALARSSRHNRYLPAPHSSRAASPLPPPPPPLPPPEQFPFVRFGQFAAECWKINIRKLQTKCENRARERQWDHLLVERGAG